VNQRPEVVRRAWAAPAVVLLALVLLSAPGRASATTVSLGDSFSSGEGAGQYDAGTSQETGNGCDRSPLAWPRLLGVPKANHFACSGATTADFYESPKDPVSQLEDLRRVAAREPISKVYVTIGGNDLGFSKIVGDCVVRTCLSHMDTVELPKLHQVVEPAVAKALAETKTAAAGGQVILVGYPDLIPSPGSRFTGCGWLTDKEKPRIWKLESELDSTLAQAADSAGVTFISIGEALKGHELCTTDSWVNPVAGTSTFTHHGLVPKTSDHQGHPNARGQQAMADSVRHAEDAGAGAVPPPPPGCTPASRVAAIVDDSGSMERNDPLDIRRSALELLITKPSEQGRILGAVEFGGKAGPLFAPGVVSADRAGMLASLSALQDDGYDFSGESTDYNAAFRATEAEQPDAEARIFLTDGGHNVGPYENGHLGGPRTYVIGLNIGPAGEGNSEADLLGKIASDTGGDYFPLLREDGDSPATQYRRLQPVFNAIDALLECQGAPQQSVVKLSSVNAPAPPVHASFAGAAGLEVVVSWATPNTKVGMASASVRNAGGRVVANLSGKAPHHAKSKRRKVPAPEALQPGVVEGPTFETITLPKPPHGANLQISVAASELPTPSAVSVQISPLETLPVGTPGAPPTGSVPAGAPPTVVLPATSPSPAPTEPPGSPGSPPSNHLEQETPNHPVNTFTNYHNASGMGPAIAAGQWVEVSCRVYDPTIASVNPDGYWYRIASPPWSNSYYSPANTFMNGDPYGGPYTHNTDFSVPVC
jgi:GDSL-like Lipase/Acylhydrolase family